MAMRRRLATALILNCALAVTLFAGVAHAQVPVRKPDTKVLVEATYREALAAYDKGDYPAACAKLEEVTKLDDDKLIAHLKLGSCYQSMGKLTTAWKRYVIVREKAEKAGLKAEAQSAAERIAALVPQLATLTVVVPNDVRSSSGLVITLDGQPLNRDEWGSSHPIDSGAHSIVVQADNYAPWQRDLKIADGDK